MSGAVRFTTQIFFIKLFFQKVCIPFKYDSYLSQLISEPTFTQLIPQHVQCISWQLKEIPK